MAKSDVAKERFFNLPVIVLISLSFMLGMSEFIVVGVLPDIAAGLKVSEVTVGNLVSLFAFVYAPVTPLGSALSARFPRFATHLTLVGVFLIGNVLCAFASNYGVLVVARILIALVSGTLVAIAMTYAPDVTTEQYRTKFIAWVFSGFSIASVVGVPVGTWVANTFGWRWAFHLVNVLTMALIVLMVMVLPRNSHIVKIGFLPQFRLFFDRRIQLGVLDVVFGAFSVRRRRLEYAGALHSGQSKGAQLLEITAETMIWSGLACASSAALLSAYCVRMSSADAMTVWLGVMRTLCAIFAGVMVSSMLVGMTIRETQLFRFFKQR